MEAIKEKKFTSGPWIFRHSNSNDAYNVIGTIPGLKYKIARCPYYKCEDVEINERSRLEAESNAKLIASAPELLEALLAIIDAQDDPEKSLANLNQAIESSRQAIQKATS